MNTDRPDDRADVIEAAAKILHDMVCVSRLRPPHTSETARKQARALSDAGLLVTPAEQHEAHDGPCTHTHHERNC